MSRKPAKKLPVKVASRWKKKALKEEEEEAHWASVISAKKSKSQTAIKQIELAQQQIQSFLGADNAGEEKNRENNVSESENGEDCDSGGDGGDGSDNNSVSDDDSEDHLPSRKKKKRDGLKKKEKEKDRLIKKRSKWSGRRRLKGKEIDEDDDARWKAIIRQQQQQAKKSAAEAVIEAVEAAEKQVVSSHQHDLNRSYMVQNNQNRVLKSAAAVIRPTKTMNPALLKRLQGSTKPHGNGNGRAEAKGSSTPNSSTSSATAATSFNNIFDVLSTNKKKRKKNVIS